jgi:hypothetical protein
MRMEEKFMHCMEHSDGVRIMRGCIAMIPGVCIRRKMSIQLRFQRIVHARFKALEACSFLFFIVSNLN